MSSLDHLINYNFILTSFFDIQLIKINEIEIYLCLGVCYPAVPILIKQFAR